MTTATNTNTNTKIDLSIDETCSIINSDNKHIPFTVLDPINIKGEIKNIGLINDVYSQLKNNNSVSRVQLNIGVDEVGRGPLYGSVVIAAAILPHPWSGETLCQPLKNTPLSILTDSKKLTETKRERLNPLIKRHALAYVVVDIPASVIDDLNILQATLVGMRLACEQLLIEVTKVFNDQPKINHLLSHQHQKTSIYGMLQPFNYYEHNTANRTEPIIMQFNLLFDGNKIPKLDWQYLNKHDGACSNNLINIMINSEAWVKGDLRHTAIAAASVLAKVERDGSLKKDGLFHPGYGLENHKGYPTKAHIKAIQKLGVLAKHRRSFKPVKEALNQTKT